MEEMPLGERERRENERSEGEEKGSELRDPLRERKETFSRKLLNYVTLLLLTATSLSSHRNLSQPLALTHTHNLSFRTQH
ncbi:hypothetical protein JHK87_018614 [Glycine soja]|nr:hypothetical protein JHK87_018614 [Glycine soja]